MTAPYVPMSPRLSSPAHPSSGGGGVAGAGRGRGRGEDRRNIDLIGHTVRIVQGPYKGTKRCFIDLHIYRQYNNSRAVLQLVFPRNQHEPAPDLLTESNHLHRGVGDGVKCVMLMSMWETCHRHHHAHIPSWSVAVSTRCFQCSRS